MKRFSSVIILLNLKIAGSITLHQTFGSLISSPHALSCQPCDIAILLCYFFQYYGFPRLYRRFAEFNRRVTSDRQTLRRRQEVMKFVFRIPNKILAFFRYVTYNCAAYLCTYTQTCGFYIAYIYTVCGLVCAEGFIKVK